MSRPRRGETRYVFRSRLRRAAARVLDTAGAAAVWAVTAGRGLRPDPERLARPRRILVARLDHLGDVLFARPALQALRRGFPQARITALVSTTGAELLAREPTVDHLLPWDAPWFDRAARRPPWTGAAALVRRLRAEAFDLSLDLRGDLRHHILFFLAGIPVRAGYGITGGAFLLHRTLPLRPGAHEVERDLDLVRALGATDAPSAYTPLAVSASERTWAEACWSGRGPRILVHPGAGDPAKCRPPELFAQVCGALAADGGQVLLIGARHETGVCERVRALTARPVRSLAGETSLRQLAALAARADVLIGHDSGPAHLALTQGTPVILLWSRTNAPEEWGPWGTGARAAILKPGGDDEAGQILAQARAWLSHSTR